MSAILSLLLAAAGPVETERAFAAMAQREGQWTAFRAFAAPDAVMFAPQPVAARAFLEGRADPPVAVMWWPAESWRSCDGSVAVNSGPWARRGGTAFGYFTTVWQRQPDGGWKWVYDGGDALARPRPAGDAVRPVRARCGQAAMPDLPAGDGRAGGGASSDGSLRWAWTVAADGTRRFRVTLAGRVAPAVDETVAP